MKIPPEVLKIADDIREMRIRGASRIAQAGALSLKIAAEKFKGRDVNEYMEYIRMVSGHVRATRPTAVSLPNALSYVISRTEKAYRSGVGLSELVETTIKSAENFIQYSRTATKRIGEIGAGRLRDGDTILTHCNSSAALSVIIHAVKQGKSLNVLATETRPKFQGHITVRMLAENGVKVTLIPDSAVRLFMKDIDKVVVGADTVTANGAVVNKIGTSMIALAAHEARTNLFVAAESYKFSPATVVGELVKIEERSPTEVVSSDFMRKHPGIKIRNPAFDVTPPEYIDAIITERGVIPPQAAILILREEYGWAIRNYMLKATSEIEDAAY